MLLQKLGYSSIDRFEIRLHYYCNKNNNKSLSCLTKSASRTLISVVEICIYSRPLIFAI